MVEVVDRAGSVLEIVPRHRMRAERLRHRCTYVAVIEGQAELLAGNLLDSGLDGGTRLVVHQRADWKDTYPSYWDMAFGGVCGVGESWRPSAERELAEEAGIEGAVLHDLGPTSYEGQDNRVVGRLFLTAWPTEPICVDGEVVAIDYVTIDELDSWAASVEVCPDSLASVVPALQRLVSA